MLHLDTHQPVFRALADPTRRAILKLLSEAPLRVNDIADHFDMTRPAVAKHLDILEHAQLIATEKKGRERLNHLTPAPLAQAADWLSFFDHFWDQRLADLKTAVETSYDRDENR